MLRAICFLLSFYFSLLKYVCHICYRRLQFKLLEGKYTLRNEDQTAAVLGEEVSANLPLKHNQLYFNNVSLSWSYHSCFNCPCNLFSDFPILLFCVDMIPLRFPPLSPRVKMFELYIGKQTRIMPLSPRVRMFNQNIWFTTTHCFLSNKIQKIAAFEKVQKPTPCVELTRLCCPVQFYMCLLYFLKVAQFFNEHCSMMIYLLWLHMD